MRKAGVVGYFAIILEDEIKSDFFFCFYPGVWGLFDFYLVE